jgi:hypothetical protein
MPIVSGSHSPVAGVSYPTAKAIVVENVVEDVFTNFLMYPITGFNGVHGVRWGVGVS